MKNIKRFDQINESSEKKIKITVTLEMSEETGRNLQGYYDCNAPEDAISEYISQLYELDGVTFKYNVEKE